MTAVKEGRTQGEQQQWRSAGLLQQILSLKLRLHGQRNTVPQLNFFLLLPQRVLWVVPWALVSSLFFHVPAGLLALLTPGHRKYGRFMSVSILLMSIMGPIAAGILRSAVIAGANRATGKEMIPFEALASGTGHMFCVAVGSLLWVLATLYTTLYTLML